MIHEYSRHASEFDSFYRCVYSLPRPRSDVSRNRLNNLRWWARPLCLTSDDRFYYVLRSAQNCVLETAKLAARSLPPSLDRRTTVVSETDGPALFPSHLGASGQPGEGQHLFEAFLNGRLNYLVAASCTWRKPQREEG